MKALILISFLAMSFPFYSGAAQFEETHEVTSVPTCYEGADTALARLMERGKERSDERCMSRGGSPQFSKNISIEISPNDLPTEYCGGVRFSVTYVCWLGR